MATETLWLVDDDEFLRQRLARAIGSRGYQVQEAAGYDLAVEQLPTLSADRAVIDLKMAGGTGLDLLRLLRKHSPETRVVMLTGYGSIASAVEAMRQGATGYVTKPADADQVLAAFDAQPAVEVATAEQFQPPSLAEAEWNHIQQVMADCNGNLSRAANLLGIPRRTLQRKLKKLAP